MKLQKKLLLLGLMLVGICGLLVGCGGDPYDKIRISADRSNISLHIELDDGVNGLGAVNTAASVLEQVVTVNVSGAPKQISSAATVMSLNESVARAEVISSSGGKTRVKITAVNGGNTQIRAMTSGGGKSAYINVDVSIPAKAVEVKNDIYFGVNRGSSVELRQSDFNFFASVSLKDSNYVPTDKTVVYSFASKAEDNDNSAEFLKFCSISGNVLSVAPNAPVGSGKKIQLISTIASTGIVADEAVDVYVFEPLKAEEIFVPDVIQLVKNSSGTGYGDVATGSVTVDGVGWTFNENWGYWLVNNNELVVRVDDSGHNGSFNFAAYGVGQTTVDVVVYPIYTDPNNPLRKVHFNRGYSDVLQKTKSIKVESRNIFKADGIAFTKDGESVTDAVNSFYSDDVTKEVREFFRIGVCDGDEISDEVINNTDSVRNNNYVTFELYLGGVKKQRVYDYFKITYCDWSFHDHVLDKTMLAGDYINGVPYDCLFSIAIKDPSILQNPEISVELYVKSVLEGAGAHAASVKAKVDVTCIQSINEIDVVNSTGKVVDTIYPVVGSYASEPFTRINDLEFYLDTDKDSKIAYFDFECGVDKIEKVEGVSGGKDYYSFGFTVVEEVDDGNGEIEEVDVFYEMFRIIKEGQVGSGKTKYLMRVNPELAEAGTVYNFSVIYRNGCTKDFSVKVLRKLSQAPSIEIAEISGDMIYRQTWDGDMLTAFVRINGTYSIDVNALPAGSIAGFSILESVEELAASGLDISSNNGQILFKPVRDDSEITFHVSVNAYNDEVFGDSNHQFVVRLVVVNPIVAASFDKNYVTVLSARSLGLDESESFVDFSLVLQYADGSHPGLAPEGKPYQTFVDFNYGGNSAISLIENPDRPNEAAFRLQGLRDSLGDIDVRFTIKQVYTVNGCAPVVIDFTSSSVTSGQGLHFFVRVKDAVTIDSITPIDVGEYLDITISGSAAGSVITSTPTTVFVRTSIYPAIPHNAKLGYGFEWAGAFDNTYVRDSDGNEIITVDPLTGLITARGNNINNPTDITLVIYAQDSLKDGQAWPRTYVKLSIFIYDVSMSKNHRVINNRDDFLNAFYVSTRSGYSIFDNAKAGFIASRTTADLAYCYFQLAADIDLSYMENGVKKYLSLPPVAQFGTAEIGSSAVFSGTKQYVLNGGPKTTSYSIINYRITEAKYTYHYEVASNYRTENYGFFSKIGKNGVVEGINFESASASLIPPSTILDRAQINVGFVAAVNEGTLRAVSVYVGQQDSFFYSVSSSRETANIGAVVGVNNGIIEEGKGSVYATGTMAIGLNPVYESAYNFGGIVGLNNGYMYGKQSAGTVLSENILINSDVVLIVINGNGKESSSGWYDPLNEREKNIGGIAGKNTGYIAEFSSEAVIFTTARGNSGGLVGYNTSRGGIIAMAERGWIEDSYSNGAMYARGTMGGLVGRNREGSIRNCYYDFYLNSKIKDNLYTILRYYVDKSVWNGEIFYAGMIVASDAGNTGSYYDLSQKTTVVGGVVGVNDSGNVYYSFASSAFDNKTEYIDVFDLPFRGDIYIYGAERIAVGGIIGRQQNTVYSAGVSKIEGCYSNLSIYYNDKDGAVVSSPIIGGIVGYLNAGSVGINDGIDRTSRAEFKNCFTNITVNLGDYKNLGLYSSVQEYQYHDAVYDAYAGDTYVYVNSQKSVGKSLADTAYWKKTDRITIGGFIGFGNSLPETHGVKFSLCYSYLDTSSVVGWAGNSAKFDECVDPISVVNAKSTNNASYISGVYFNSVIYVAGTQTRVSNATVNPAANSITRFTSEAQQAAERAKDPADRDSTILVIQHYLDDFTDDTLSTWNIIGGSWATAADKFFMVDESTNYPYPLIRQQAPNNDKPLFIAAPVSIEIKFSSAQVYADFYGDKAGKADMKNNRGGYNFVIPESDDADCNRAAVFLSTGSYYPSGIIANRYYLDDLFGLEDVYGVKVSPEIAANRVAFEVDGSADVVEKGVELDASGTPKYYIEVKKVGSFDIVIQSTRDVHLVPLSERVTIDVVDGIKYLSAVTPIVGTIGYKSLLSRDEIVGGANFYSDFSIQKSMEFTLRAETDSKKWGVSVYLGVKEEQDNMISPCTISYDTDVPFDNDSTFMFDKKGSAKFGFVPYYIINGVVYHCYALKFEITVTVYGGAVELSLAQSNNAIDGTSSAVYDGVFVTDTAPSVSGVPAVAKLLDLTSFSFVSGNSSYPLFRNHISQIEAGKPVQTVVNVRNGQSFAIIFEIQIDDDGVIDPLPDMHGYYAGYYFKILMSVVVSEAYYSALSEQVISESVSAIPSGIEGTILAIENENTGYYDGEPKMASAGVEIVAQELQSVEIQHYSKTEITSGGILTGGDAVSLDDAQQQSMNIFTEHGKGGMFKIYASPYFANISEFTLESKPCYQLVGYTDDYENPQPIYQEWNVGFTQLVYDVNSRKYVKLALAAGSSSFEEGKGSRGKFYQVSTVDNGVYSWTGVYYVQTYLIEPEQPVIRIQEGQYFEISARFVSHEGAAISRDFKLFALDMPGLYFQYEGIAKSNVEQAVGTTADFTISTVGNTVVTGYTVRANGVVQADNSLVDVVKNYDDYSVYISPSYNLASGPVTITFDYYIIEAGAHEVASKTLTITPVLFKVRGFTMDGINGSAIRLVNSNRQRAALRASIVASDYVGLQTQIEDALFDFHRAINTGAYSEYIQWTSNGYVLNTEWNSETEYYESTFYGNMNFYLGKSNNSRINPSEKFIVAASADSQTCDLGIEMFYEYVKGLPVIKQYDAERSISTFFQVITVQKSDEETPIIIDQSNSNLLRYMYEGNHYILMEDIELNGWVPTPFVAASLDGNNKKIKINSFNLAASPTEIGLFSYVDTGCVLKNINIVLPGDSANYQNSLEIDLTRYTATKAVSVGCLAGQNFGIITNCAVLSGEQFDMDGIADYSKTTFENGKAKSSVIVYVGNENLDVRVGGLVGENGTKSGKPGVVSNSRVMSDITISSYISNEINTRSIIVAGVAAVNSGTIVSSLFRDANITNYAKHRSTGSQPGYNYTAGLVGTNSGTVKGSYVMGVAGEIDESLCVTSGEIKSFNGNVGGFAYNNTGVIEDCYVNAVLNTVNSAIAGFVYSNTGSGTVSNCVVNNPRSYDGRYSAFDYPVANANSDGIVNCKYVSYAGRAFNDEHSSYLGKMDIAQFLSLDQYDDFSIDRFGAGEEVVTIWQMTDFGPRLVSANEIAISIRIVEPVFDAWGRNIVNYLPEYSYGSKINPVIITNGDQFNRYVYESTDAYLQDQDESKPTDYEKNIYQGNLRLVNNISLLNGTDLISLRGVLHTYKTIFKGVLDGNGLSISNIAFENTETGLRSAGLFSKLEYATVKNISLGFVQYQGGYSISATATTYVGGLAGISINSNIVDVDLKAAANSKIGGRNIVGGLVGIAVAFETEEDSFNTRIQNIVSDVSVEAGHRSGTQYIYDIFESMDEYMRFNYSNMQIAGGVIGAVVNNPGLYKVTDASGEFVDMSILQKNVAASVVGKDQNGQNVVDYVYRGVISPQRDGGNISGISNRVGSAVSVRGEIVGGLFGMVCGGINVSDICYDSSALTLQGKFFVGGLVGANFGTVESASIKNGEGSLPIVVSSDSGSSFIYYNNTTNGNYHGMVVGGAVAYNTGVMSRVVADIVLSSGNMANVLIVGGLVGENWNTVEDCVIKSSSTEVGNAVNGGFYVGGLIGKNFGTRTAISRNSVLVTVEKGGVVASLFTSGIGSVFAWREGATVVTSRASFAGELIGLNEDSTIVKDELVALYGNDTSVCGEKSIFRNS